MSGQLSLSNLVTSNLTADFINTTNLSVDFINKSLLPSNPDVSLGSDLIRFKDLFVSQGTIHVGAVSLSEKDGSFSSSAPFQFGEDGDIDKVIIGTSTGIVVGTTRINSSSMTFENGEGEVTTVDNSLFTQIENIAKTEASTQLTKNSDDFGFLTDYIVSIDNDSSGSNNIRSINNGNFQVGKLFNTNDSLNLNSFIIITKPNFFFDFDATGAVTLLTQAQKTNRLNKRIDNNSINVRLNATNQVLIPIETNTTIRDVFPLNILDMNKKDGRLKFKADFDNVGSLYYLDQVGKMSGLCN
jgi:hypothetical protein